MYFHGNLYTYLYMPENYKPFSWLKLNNIPHTEKTCNDNNGKKLSAGEKGYKLS